jgi:hypothetical protein
MRVWQEKAPPLHGSKVGAPKMMIIYQVHHRASPQWSRRVSRAWASLGVERGRRFDYVYPSGGTYFLQNSSRRSLNGPPNLWTE